MPNDFFATSPFQSFWMGGFECTDQLNAFGHRVDFLPLTGHLPLLDDDYSRLQEFSIGSVREGIRWSQIEKTPYHYDWSTVQVMLDAGRRHGIQQIWDLCHFGYPDDLTPLHPMFARRFAFLCRAFVDFYRQQRPDDVLIVTPINEVSFMSWLGGDVRGTSPYCVGQGWEVKRGLMRAYIEGVAALQEADPTIRILTTEPLIRIVPRFGASAGEVRRAKEFDVNQFQSVDMLCGRICPELGGRPEYLDLLGFNYYYDNQWQLEPHQTLPWANDFNDPRFRLLSHLLKRAYKRYGRPVVLTETSHPGVDRPFWIKMIAEESAAAIRAGVPLLGVCLYPIIDRPDWDHLTPWHRAGLWDVDLGHPEPGLTRVLHEPSAEALRVAQAQVSLAQQKAAKRRFSTVPSSL
ncbi:Beta-glucosidase/6-phospho-beta-glucosidase/beta-galactosidase [Hymenobacter gelipurpurascens]|uniref:Beta-glucosidase/6-phospho-beta-glucosidase/beta-galactosidase n=1 Tax=Hymenobacter gelipurpurascens TaxID=89968 RepID=A0A212UDR2_9BACT|nr:amine oxidase [Hymenobacter gelipurpurascens]SNC76385.1 Beta-glucosidase/6-phospho-beta-glucosidase/beta-galactosidase [Hymenobacter gelipurpurascens]